MPDKAFSELSKAEKLKKAKAARRKAHGVLEGPSRSNKASERTSAFQAKKAASRVEKRLTGKYPNDSDLRAPGKGWVREGVEGVLDMLRKAVKLPGKAKEGLRSAEEASRGGK